MAGQSNCPKCGNVLPALDSPCTRCLLASGVDALEERPLGPGFLDDLPMPGDSIVIAGKYRVLETLGRGGMGVVYKAWQENLDRTVAVKTISAGAHASDVQRERFQREAKVVAALCHAAIVAIYDWGEDGGVPFFSMEYVEGRDLAKVLRDGVLNAEPAARLVQEVADAVQYAHDQGVLHRDLKPSNVIIDRRGRPKITDFGLAKRLEGGESLTMSGQLLGSIEYLPPEQISAKKGGIGPWSDVYGIGTILYQALTGRPPFTGATMPEVLEKVVNGTPIPPRRTNLAIPVALEAICLKCLEKDPKRRYATARELSEELGRFIQGEPLLITKRRPSPALVWSAIGLLVTGVLALWFWSDRQRHGSKEEPTSITVEHRALPVAAVQGSTFTTTQRLIASNVETILPKPASNLELLAVPKEVEPAPIVVSAPIVAAKHPVLDHAWTNDLGMVFAPIPGSENLVAIWETRVRDYAAFVAASGYTNNLKWRNPGFAQTENDPVVNVNWQDAQIFCQWLTKKERQEDKLSTNQIYRLPMDREWSKAAGLAAEYGDTPRARSGKIKALFPWGKTWPPPPASGNFADQEYNKNKLVPSAIISMYNDKYPRTAPVGSFHPNESGLYDIAGNVWEWCLDSFDTGDQPKEEADWRQDSAGRSREEEMSSRVLRGGSWDTADSSELLSSFRYDLGPLYRLPNVGFRCVLCLTNSGSQ
jgi:serine/threonine protein kinase/formylglycine-generating enzyme required for sulfatase activity